MNITSFKRISVSAGLILVMSLLVMCSSAEVKVAPKQEPEVKTSPKLKVINSITVMINFDFDESSLSRDDITELDKAVEFVKKYPKNKIHIDGYSDIVGTEDYNVKLSERRANVTKEYLIKHANINPMNITAMGRGTIDPIGDRKTEAGRTMNRRAVISIVSD